MITNNLIANVLRSAASLLEVTGWSDSITRNLDGSRTSELDLPAAMNQVIQGRNGLWRAARTALLNEIGNGAMCLAEWNDSRVDISEVITLCQRTAHNLTQSPTPEAACANIKMEML